MDGCTISTRNSCVQAGKGCGQTCKLAEAVRLCCSCVNAGMTATQRQGLEPGSLYEAKQGSKQRCVDVNVVNRCPQTLNSLAQGI